VIIPNDGGKVELFKLMEELARRELNEIPSRRERN